MKPFKSFLAAQLEAYIGYRRSLGFSDKSLRSQLRTFDRYLFEQNVESKELTAAFFLNLKNRFSQKPHSFNALLRAVRGFFGYLVRIQIVEQNPLTDIQSYKQGAFIPFVFSAHQTRDLIGALGRGIRKQPEYYFLDYSVYIAVLLLARCGLRISEPLRLDPGHYNSSLATVYIEKTKFSKDRLIPVPLDVKVEIDNYIAVRNTFLKYASTEYLLVGANANQLSKRSVYKRFNRAVKKIGMDQPRRIIANTTFGPPTPHSLRHSFAINTLKRIRQQGGSAQNALPILSSYLGHRKYRYTAVYLKVIDAEHRQGLVDFAISRQKEI